MLSDITHGAHPLSGAYELAVRLTHVGRRTHHEFTEP